MIHVSEPRILLCRMGSMGDVIHVLPALSLLRRAIPRAHLTWLVEARWRELLLGNPQLDLVLTVDRGTISGLWTTFRRLRSRSYDLAIDFQGLIKSALAVSLSGAANTLGFHESLLREAPAAAFYSSHVRSRSRHVVDRYLDLAAAAVGLGTKATPKEVEFVLPPGSPEGEPLPSGGFVLASPLAGWGGKQWPVARWRELAQRLPQETGMPLVLNGPRAEASGLGEVPGAVIHRSGIPGLIFATRRARAVIGLDSGPMHLAAALGVPGVALFGPTDPRRNGPYGDSFTVVRSPNARTSYRRMPHSDRSMWDISVEDVLAALSARLAPTRPRGSSE